MCFNLCHSGASGDDGFRARALDEQRVLGGGGGDLLFQHRHAGQGPVALFRTDGALSEQLLRPPGLGAGQTELRGQRVPLVFGGGQFVSARAEFEIAKCGGGLVAPGNEFGSVQFGDELAIGESVALPDVEAGDTSAVPGGDLNDIALDGAGEGGRALPVMLEEPPRAITERREQEQHQNGSENFHAGTLTNRDRQGNAGRRRCNGASVRHRSFFPKPATKAAYGSERRSLSMARIRPYRPGLDENYVTSHLPVSYHPWKL